MGRFLLLRKIGSGSSCEVFEAVDLAQSRQRVAIKKARAHPTPATMAALRSEFSILSRLHHPHLVEAFDLHVVTGTEPAFLTLELIGGQPFLEAAADMPVARVLRLICEVCSGLVYLHRHGVVHRDIKSDNILVEPAHGESCVKIMDLSLASAEGQPLSARTGGTPLYSPPEVLAGQPGDPRSDLFSVGVLAYRVLAGSFPFDTPGRWSSETRPTTKNVSSTPSHTPLHVVAPHLAPEICYIVERLLSLEPDHRFQTAGELELALRPHAEPTGANTSLVAPAGRWPLVGRRQEMSRVQAAMDRLAPVNIEGLPAVERSFMVLGEAGTGKSRLLREISRTCQLAGMPTFMGDAAFLSGVPFGVVLHFLEQIAGWLEHLVHSDARCQTLLASCERLLQRLASDQNAVDTWGEDEVVQLLADLSLVCPFALIVDNFQDVDIASRRYLLALLRDPARTRLLTVLAARSEPTHPARNPAASSAELVETIEFGPLSENDMDTLIGELFPSSIAHPHVAAQFNRLTGGQPVFLDLVIQALHTDGLIEMKRGEPVVDPDGLDDLAVPPSIQTSVREWIARCPDTELHVLEALAVTEHPTLPQVIAHLLDEDPAATTVDNDIEALLARGGIRRDTGVVSGAVSMSHALVREAVYERMNADRRKKLHERCVELLLRDRSESVSVDPAIFTRHLLAAGRHEEAAEWAIQAGEDALQTLTCDGAERFFRIGLAGATRDTPRSRLRALAGLAGAFRQLKRSDEAGALFQTLIKEATAVADDSFLARGLAGLASTYLGRSNYKQAEKLSQRALRIARRIDDPVVEERALRAVADTFHYQSKLIEAKEAYAQRVALWQRKPDDRQGATAWYGLGWVCNSMREFAEAATCLQKSAEIRRRLGDPDQLALTLSALGSNELDRGDFPTAVSHLTEALLHARRGCDRRTEANCLSNQGDALFRMGQFGQALDALHEALRRISARGNARRISPVHLAAGLVLTEQGEYTLAENHLAKAREACIELEDQPRLAHCLAAQGNLHRLLGDATTARFWCERGLEMARRVKDDQVTAVCLTHLALACHEEDRGQQAVEHLIEARTLARQTGAADTAHLADLALARALLLSGRCSEMASLLEQLMDRAEKMRLAADMTQLLLLRSLQHAHAGQHHEAAKLADHGLSRAASSSSAEVHWELRHLRLLLMDDPDCANGRRLVRDAKAWVASCNATLTDGARRRAFERRLRDRRELFARMVHESVSRARHESGTAPLRGEGRVEMPVQRPSAAPAPESETASDSPSHEGSGRHTDSSTLPLDQGDLHAGARMLSRYLPEIMQQRQLRSAVNLLVDRAIQMTRSDRGGLFLRTPSDNVTTADDKGTVAPLRALSPLGIRAARSQGADTSSSCSPAQEELVPLVLRDLQRESLEDAREMSRCVLGAALTSEQTVAKADLLRDPAWSSQLTLRVHEIPAVLAIPLIRPKQMNASTSTRPSTNRTDEQASHALGVLYLDCSTRDGSYSDADRRLGQRIATTLVKILDPILSPSPDTSILDDIASLTDRLPLEAVVEQPAEASDDVGARFGDVFLVGSGREMERIFDLTRRLATGRTPVLITGETGTGKELIAQALHGAGQRRDEPFVALDCGALPESMAEAELFGHARGAFSGADSDRMGLMRTAANGTLFLDEIGNLTQPLQLKLLRALESGEVRPIGADRAFAAPFRLVTATNIDLDTAVRQGTFRADLLHRLKGGHIDLPPLRTHMQDLEALVAYLLGKLCEATSRPIPCLSPALWDRLHRHDWPGNVRELRMGLETAMDMTPGDILGVEDMPCIARPASHDQSGLPRRPTHSPDGPGPPMSAAGINIPTTLEGRMILRTLAQNEWDKSATARQIGWSRQKLYRAMKTYGVPNRVTDDQVRAIARCMQTLPLCVEAQPVDTRRP